MPIVGLKACEGMDLNQVGNPSTAGTGCGRMASSSGGQRNLKLICPSPAPAEFI